MQLNKERKINELFTCSSNKEACNGLIDGVWLQNCTAMTLKEAIKRASDTEAINNGSRYTERTEIAVVEDILYGCPNYSFRMGLKRLDK